MDREAMKQIARGEVLEYARTFYNSDLAEWIAVAGVMRLSTFEPADLTDADLSTIYSYIADDYRAWAVEGSPNLDWENDPKSAQGFCDKWNGGKLLP